MNNHKIVSSKVIRGLTYIVAECGKKDILTSDDYDEFVLSPECKECYK